MATVTLPTISLQNKVIQAGSSLAASSFITSTSSGISKYQFRNDGTDGGYFLFKGVKQQTGVWITVLSTELSQLYYVGGNGYDSINASDYDGNWSYYGTAVASNVECFRPQFCLNTLAANSGSSVNASKLIGAIIDLNGLPITSYSFRDNGGGGGYFSLNGVKQTNGSFFNVTASNIANLIYVFGSGTDSIDISMQDVSQSYYQNTSAIGFVNSYQLQSGVSGNNFLSQILDNAIRADLTKLLSGNNLSFSSFKTLLQDVANNVNTNGLSSNQFHDLQYLVSDLNISGGILVSQYLNNIAYKLIDGDPANSFFNLGTTSSVSIGNLQVGSSQTQLNNLIQKWVLGLDNPAMVFSTSTSNSYKYTQIKSPLFGSSGLPSIDDVNQGQVGDCYLMAPLASIALSNPYALSSMINDNGDGTYGVRFYLNGKQTFITVNNYFPTNASGNAIAASFTKDIWVAVIEKAFVELNEEPGAVLGHTAGNQYSLINGYYINDVIYNLTGLACNSFYYSDYTITSWGQTKNTIINALNNKYVVDFASEQDTKDTNGLKKLISSHAFTIVSYNSADGNFLVRNPWGTSTNQDYETQFEVSMDDLYNDKADIYISSGVPASNIQNVASFIGGLSNSGNITLADISDTSVNIANQIDALQSNSTKINSISVSDASSILISFTQLTNDATALGLISGSYTLNVSGVSVANVASTLANSKVASITVSDTSANIASKLDTLQTNASKISSITQIGTATSLAITASQLTSDATALGLISGSYTFNVSAVSTSNLSSVLANTHVNTVSLSDTAANLLSALGTLESNYQKISAIKVSDNASLTVTSAQNTADVDVINLIKSGGGTVSVSPAPSATYSVPVSSIDSIGLSPDGHYLLIKVNGSTQSVATGSTLQFNGSLLDTTALQQQVTKTAPVFQSTGGSGGYTLPDTYTGPSSLGLQYQLIESSDNAVVTAPKVNAFIKLASTNSVGKAVNGGGGASVIDGGVGSTFVTGGVGHNDTFFLDGRAPGVSWSTITDFMLGTDKATIWGFVKGVSSVNASFSDVNTGGASGYQGLTLHFNNLLQDGQTSGSNPNLNSITLTGHTLAEFGATSLADLNNQINNGTNSHLSVGSTQDSLGTHSYLWIH